MKIIIYFLFLISLNAIALPLTHIEVVLNDKQKNQLANVDRVRTYSKIHNAQFKIYSTDDVEKYEEMLSKGLSSIPEIAKKQIEAKRHKMGEKKLAALSVAAYKSNILIMQYRLAKSPAIIFNRKHVVYGELDLYRALTFFIQKKAK